MAFLGIAYHRHEEREARKRLMITAALFATVLASALALAWHDEQLRIYQPPRTLFSYPLRAWQSRLPQELPQVRDDLRGSADQPLNLILAGDPRCLLESLAGRGWREAA